MLIIDDDNKCKCGAYWQGNGYCANGHLRILNKMDKLGQKQKDEYLDDITYLMDGREYCEEMTGISEQELKLKGVVVLFGGGDDLAEFRGAVHEEFSVYGGGVILMTDKGFMVNRCEYEDCPYHEEEKEKGVPIEAQWDNDGYSWTYQTVIPHKTFDIMEDGDKYCRGIVFYLSDVRKGE